MLDLSGPYTLRYSVQWDAHLHILPLKHGKQVRGTWKFVRFRIFLRIVILRSVLDGNIGQYHPIVVFCGDSPFHIDSSVEAG